MKSGVHPKYKTKYRIGNWPEFDRSLVQRGNLTLWLSPDAIAGWNAKPSCRRGGQRKYSDVAIETALTVRLLLHLPLRQTEGFLLSIFELMDIHLDVPDHTTLSRRSGQLDLPLRSRRVSGPIDFVIDSSGLAIFGEGEWAAVKHGGKGIQGWKKLHLGVDETGVIVTETLTNANIDDATTGIALVDQVTGDIDTIIGDTAYDTRPFYEAAAGRDAKIVVPPMKNARVGGASSRSSCPSDSPGWAKAMEERGGLLSTVPWRERLFQIQDDHRRSDASPWCRCAIRRSAARLQHAQPDD